MKTLIYVLDSLYRLTETGWRAYQAMTALQKGLSTIGRPSPAYLEIQVPTNMDISSLEIETISGDVSVEGTSVDMASIMSTSGDMQIGGNIKEVEAVSTSGDLYIKDINRTH